MWRAIPILFLACVATNAADDPNPEPPGALPAELRKLQGRWTVTRMIIRKIETRPVGSYVFTFRGTTLTSEIRNVKHTTRVKFDSKQPHRLELIPEGKTAGQVCYYKLDRGELHLVYLPKGVNGPPNFDGDNGLVFVLRRPMK